MVLPTVGLPGCRVDAGRHDAVAAAAQLEIYAERFEPGAGQLAGRSLKVQMPPAVITAAPHGERLRQISAARLQGLDGPSVAWVNVYDQEGWRHHCADHGLRHLCHQAATWSGSVEASRKPLSVYGALAFGPAGMHGNTDQLLAASSIAAAIRSIAALAGVCGVHAVRLLTDDSFRYLSTTPASGDPLKGLERRYEFSRLRSVQGAGG
jgi:hypothetical protein